MEIEKLDTILSLMNEQEGYRIVTPEMAQSCVSPQEFWEYSKKLIRDKHAVLLDKDKGFLMLTPKGAKHISLGGYKNRPEPSVIQQHKKEKQLMVFSLAVILVSLCIVLFRMHLFFAGN